MVLPARHYTLHALALIALTLAHLAWGGENISPEELLEQGDHLGAIRVLEEYAGIYQEELAGSNDSATAEKLARVEIWLGSINLEVARSDAAVKHFKRASGLLDKTTTDPGLLGTCYDGLGRSLHHLGKYQAAREALETALRHRESLPEGQRKEWTSATREHLGLLLLAMGEYQAAGESLAIAISDTNRFERGLLAQREASLGRYFHTIRSYAQSRKHLEQALSLAEQSWGRSHPNTFTILDQLGLTLLRQGEVATARAAFEEAAELARAQADTIPGGLRYATILNNFSNLLLEEEAVSEAQEIFRTALATLTKTLGEEHPALAPLKNNLAYAHLAQGDYETALQLFGEARDIYLDSVGPKHQRTVESLTNLALASFLGELPGSREHIREAVGAHELVLRELLAFGSEIQRLNYLQRVDPVSLPCSAGDDPELIANLLIRTKGRLLDALLAEKSRRATEDADGEPTWQDVQAQLIPASALIDFVRYHSYETAQTTTIRYGAILLTTTAPPQWIPLGKEDTLVNWLGVIRERLAWRSTQLGGADPSPPPPLKLRPALRRLHDEFWAPVAATLPTGTETVVLCPDGTLNFLSFATLLDPDDRFLGHEFPLVTHVSSSRDLLAPNPTDSLTNKPWAIFSVDEFIPADASANPRSPHELQLGNILGRLQTIAGANREVELLARHQPPGSKVLQGAEASEIKLRALDSQPAVLHLVTHGFFLSGDQTASSRLIDFDEDPAKLKRSGLVLQRPDMNGPDEANDILFASDVARLDLRGTRLVTISSCDSGLGEDLAGEGVLGLRRGFALAGAQNQFLALWPVSDESTPAFMDRFYQLAVHSDHPAQAAWQTQREFLSGADPGNEQSLEEAVLRYGPFVLCQREALRPLVASLPPSRGKPFTLSPTIAVGLAALILVGLLHWKARRRGQNT